MTQCRQCRQDDTYNSFEIYDKNIYMVKTSLLFKKIYFHSKNE